MNALLLVLPGAVVALGVVLIALAFRPRHVRLADAFAVLADTGADVRAAEMTPTDRWELPGRWWVRTRRVTITPDLERQLRLRGRSLSGHYTHKLVGAAAGLLAPFVLTLLGGLLLGSPPLLPLVAAPVLAAVGFLAPDLLLRSGSEEAAQDATESLLTFFDLVTLERLANQSGSQALHAAAALSDAPVFVAIRGALERARLEQRAPWTDLRELGRELDLPALRDLADVMRLDETGASLSGALRARVRELRDAHLSALKIAAAEGSERMTTWMVIPSVAFGLFFLVPPLLTLVTSG